MRSLLLLAGLSPLLLTAAPVSVTTVLSTWNRFASPIDSAMNVDNWVNSGGNVAYTSNYGGTLASNFAVPGTFTFKARVTPTRQRR